MKWLITGGCGFIGTNLIKELIPLVLVALHPSPELTVQPGATSHLRCGMNFAEKDAREPFREPVTMVMVSDGQDNMKSVPPRIVAEKIDRLDPVCSVIILFALARG